MTPQDKDELTVEWNVVKSVILVRDIHCAISPGRRRVSSDIIPLGTVYEAAGVAPYTPGPVVDLKTR